MTNEQFLKQTYVIQMPNGEEWGVPVRVIVEDYANNFGDTVEEAAAHLKSNFYELLDWSQGNMHWEDVKGFAVFRKRTRPIVNAYEEGWHNGAPYLE